MAIKNDELVQLERAPMNFYPSEPPMVQGQSVATHEPIPQATFTREEMDSIFYLCRSDDWHGVLQRVHQNPTIATTSIIMDNHISTTIIHQAVTSKGNTALRAEVISTILRYTPQAASIKNGYGSLPIHVIAQRNTKMDAQTKERLIFELVVAYPGALTEEGGVGKRTPLHIIFTDYISPRLTRMIIEKGGQACFMKDKKGYLPAHVACSRHCSPEKLRMLLAVNPQSLFDKTNKGETILDLAKSTATKSHPNYALIDELNRQLPDSMVRVSSEEESDNRSRLGSNDSAKSWHTYDSMSPPHGHRNFYGHPHMEHQPQVQHYFHESQEQLQQYEFYQYHNHHNPVYEQSWTHSPMMQRGSHTLHDMDYFGPTPSAPQKQKRASRKRKNTADDTEPAADLLLHFSRTSNNSPVRHAEGADLCEYPQMAEV